MGVSSDTRPCVQAHDPSSTADAQGAARGDRRSPQRGPGPRAGFWEGLRWGPLLSLAGRGPLFGRIYAEVVARVEHRRDPERRRVAESRIARWLGVDEASAGRIFVQALRSEALEESEIAAVLRSDDPEVVPIVLEGWQGRGPRPRIYGVFHAGSPVLVYLELRRRFEPQLRLLARELDENNPMGDAKRRFASRKVGWVENATGESFFDTRGTALLEAREHLLAGRPLFAAFDVPGDVVARAGEVSLFGERVLLASGVFELAALTGADIQLVFSKHGPAGVRAWFRPSLEASTGDEFLAGVGRELEDAIRSMPGENWFWPFFANGR
jgi:hypothetical protein